MLPRLTYISTFFLQPIRLFQSYDRHNLRPDLLAGLTTAIVSIPQAIVFAQIAGLPLQMGLYASIISGAVAAFWGNSKQLYTGPTNVVSLLVLSVLLTAVKPDTPEYIVAAGVLAIMAGIFQLAIGLSRLGALVNFVSHSVLVGFTAGAGVLIIVQQLRHLFGLELTGRNLLQIIVELVTRLPQTHWPTLALGLGTLLLMAFIRRFKSKLPDAFISMVIISTLVFIFGLDKSGVKVVGQLPVSLPPLAELSLLNFDLIARLATGALAIGAIGLVQTGVVVRSIAVQTGQRLQINQEFVGQGLGNIAVGLFSGYPCCGSISGSILNFKVGAQTQFSAIFSSVFMLIGMFVLAPLAVYLPLTALAGVLIMAGYNMIDKTEIKRMGRTAPADALIMLITFVGTLFLRLDFAVLAGIMLSFVRYILKTSLPQVYPAAPDRRFEHFVRQRHGQPSCPQLGILHISGDLYFGAVGHIEDAIVDYLTRHPSQHFLMLRMLGVNHCDLQGVQMLQDITRRCRAQGGDLFLMRVAEPVLNFMRSTGFYAELGQHNILTGDHVISHLFRRVLDPNICIYECPVKVFRECQNLPKQIYLADMPLPAHTAIDYISPEELNAQLEQDQLLQLVDVREPREFKRGHIAQAKLMPLSKMVSNLPNLADDPVFVCQSGWRSSQALYLWHDKGHQYGRILAGGLSAWKTAGFEQVQE